MSNKYPIFALILSAYFFSSINLQAQYRPNAATNSSIKKIVDLGGVCKEHADCKSKNCYPGPLFNENSEKYCITQDTTCGYPGTGGVKVGMTSTLSGSSYKCVGGKESPTTWKKL